MKNYLVTYTLEDGSTKHDVVKSKSKSYAIRASWKKNEADFLKLHIEKIEVTDAK